MPNAIRSPAHRIFIAIVLVPTRTLAARRAMCSEGAGLGRATLHVAQFGHCFTVDLPNAIDEPQASALIACTRSSRIVTLSSSTGASM